MNDLERRLSDLLHRGTPEPERVITSSQIAELAMDGHTPNGRRVQTWGVPLLAAASVLVAVAVPIAIFGHANNSVAPTSPPLTAPAVPTCESSQLSLTAGSEEGTAGSIYATFYLTNTTATPCSVRGFPGVSLLDATGNIVGQPATRDGSGGPSVRLGRGQRAQFIIRVGTATRTGCDVPRPSTQIQVYPPDQTVPLRIPFSTASCLTTVQSLRR